MIAPEVTQRPDPGLARGLWEASPSALYLALGTVLVAGVLYLALRLGLFRRGRRPPHASRP